MVVRRVIGKGVAPQQFPFPAEAFDAASDAASVEDRARLSCRAQQGAILEEVGGLTRSEFTVPLVDDPATIVDEVGAGGSGGGHQGISIESVGRIHHQAHGLGAAFGHAQHQAQGQQQSIHRTKDAQGWKRLSGQAPRV